MSGKKRIKEGFVIGSIVIMSCLLAACSSRASSDEATGDVAGYEYAETASETAIETGTEDAPGFDYSTEFASRTLSFGILGEVVKDDEDGVYVKVSEPGNVYILEKDLVGIQEGDRVVDSVGDQYDCDLVNSNTEGNIDIGLTDYMDGYTVKSSNAMETPDGVGIAIVSNYTKQKIRDGIVTEDNTYIVKVAEDATAIVYLAYDDYSVYQSRVSAGITDQEGRAEYNLIDLLRDPDSTLDGAELYFPLNYMSVITFDDEAQLAQYQMKWYE
jgi:hypothetical protein